MNEIETELYESFLQMGMSKELALRAVNARDTFLKESDVTRESGEIEKSLQESFQKMGFGEKTARLMAIGRGEVRELREPSSQASEPYQWHLTPEERALVLAGKSYLVDDFGHPPVHLEEKGKRSRRRDEELLDLVEGKRGMWSDVAELEE